MSEIPTDNAGRAIWWRVGERTIKRLLVLGAPLHSLEEMSAWVRNRSGVPAGILARLREEQGTEGADSGDFAEFKKAYNPKQESDTQAQLKELQAYQLYKVKKAQERGDSVAVMDATKLLTHFSNVINDEEIRAFRLGKETGDIIQRGEVVGYIHALTYWQLRCVDEFMGMITPKLIEAAAAKPLDRDAIFEIVEGPLLDARITKPIERAVGSAGAAALPKWFLDSVQESVDRIIEPASA